jgi:hypothetical protein
MYIPPGMKDKVKRSAQRRSIENFVESTSNTRFFEHTDKTFAPYVANHTRFFALFYASFSQECTTFLDGYKSAANELSELGFLVNFTAVNCMEHSLLCGYHGLSRFPPPALLLFDRRRVRTSIDDKAYRKISIPRNVRAKQFMRGLFLDLVGEVDDPYQEWETWDNNGVIMHLNIRKHPNWETEFSDSLIVLFNSAVSIEQEQQLEQLSHHLGKQNIRVVAVNCRHHDEICIHSFKPLSLPALYYKQELDEWKGFRGDIDAVNVLKWMGVEQASNINDTPTSEL